MAGGERADGCCLAGYSIRYVAISPFAVLAQLCLALDATAVIGTSCKPRLSAAFAHLAMCSIETGNAEDTPTARPRSRAAISRRPSAWSISLGVGTESRTRSALANGRLLAPAI